MSLADWAIALYVVNTTLLICHQIDSAYWREWELLRVPGGAQLNLVLNFGIVLLLLVGLVWKVADRPAGNGIALAVAFGGLVAVALHTAFLLRGDGRFRLVTSLAVLAALAPVSIAQLVVEVARLSA